MAWTFQSGTMANSMSFTLSGTTNGPGMVYAGAVAVGDLLLAAFYFVGSNDVLTMIDDQGNTWSRIQTTQDRGNGQKVSYWWASSGTAATPTVTAGFGSGNSFTAGAWEIVSFTPPAGSPNPISLEDSSVAQAASTSLSSPVTTTGGDDLVVAACLGNNYTGGVASGYSTTSALGSTVPFVYTSKTTPATYSPGITGTPSPICIIASAFTTGVVPVTTNNNRITAVIF